MRINSFLAVMAALLISAPNVTWAIYLPIVSLFIFIAFLSNSIKYSIYAPLSVLLLAIFISMKIEPRSIKYSIFFMLILVFYIIISDRYVRDGNFKITFIRWASVFITGGIILGYVGLPESFYQSRPVFDNYIFGILRQRGLYTEPAYLGYWAAILFIMAYKEKMTLCMFLFAGHLVLSASVGAFLFLSLLFLSMTRQFNAKQLGFLTAFLVFATYFFWDLAINKLASNSLDNRIINFELTYQYILRKFPMPMGFGPIFFGNVEVGITSFALLVAKALGIFVIPFLIYIVFRVRPVLGIVPLAFLALVLGNFWETPILFFMLLLMARNYQWRGNLENNREIKRASRAYQTYGRLSHSAQAFRRP